MNVVGSEIEVVKGKNGRLFLSAFGSRKFLALASDLSEWRRSVLPLLIAEIVARRDRILERGIPFVVLVAPEACGIYPEFLPDDVCVELPTSGEILASELSAAGVDAFCPSPALRASKGAVDLYCRTDSHWTHSGAYIAYRMLMERVTARVSANIVPAFSINFAVQPSFGDLGVHVEPEQLGQAETVNISGFDVEAEPSVFDIRERNIRRFTCRQGQSRALIFRDSFANALSPFLERSFAETIMIAPSPTMNDEAIDHYKPDIVILEVAERGVFTAPGPFDDWSVRTFAQDHFENATNPAAAKFQIEAVRAIQSGDAETGLVNAAMGLAFSEGTPRTYNLAWALNTMGLRQEARALAARFAQSTQDRFLYYIDADAAYHLGDLEGALASINAALAIQPRNALLLFLKAEWLRQAGCPEAAVEALSLSVRYSPTHLRSWRLLYDLQVQLGEAELAQSTLAQLVKIDPMKQ